MGVMGFSINDTIVVFDRVRENFRGMRAPAREILNASINQTLSRTVITSFVAFLTILALYIYGGGSLQGMAESMMIRSEEHTSELQSLMRISYAVFCLKKKKKNKQEN